MGILSNVKKGVKKGKKLVKKAKKGIEKVGDGVSKVTDSVDKVTDNELFEFAGNAAGSAFGMPNAGSSVRKGVNQAQSIENKIGSVYNAIDGEARKIYKATTSTVNDIQSIYNSFNEQAKNTVGKTVLKSKDEAFIANLMELFF